MVFSVIRDALELTGTASGAVSSATAAAKSVLDLVKRPEPDAVMIKERLIGLIDQLLEAKEVQMKMQDSLLELQRQQIGLDRFAQEAARYQLTKTDMGGFVYTLKPEHQAGEPAHDLCANCFQDGKKSILQRAGFNTLECQNCRASVFKKDGTGRAATVAVRTDWDPRNPYGD